MVEFHSVYQWHSLNSEIALAQRLQHKSSSKNIEVSTGIEGMPPPQKILSLSGYFCTCFRAY